MEATTEISVLAEDDVFLLMGHAEVLRMDGKREMAGSLFDLAARIALALGDEEAAKRVREVAAHR